MVFSTQTNRKFLDSMIKWFKNIEVNEKQFDNIYNQVKTLGDKGKCLTDDDLKFIIEKVGEFDSLFCR